MFYAYLKYILGECFDMVMGDRDLLLEGLFVVWYILYKKNLQRYNATILLFVVGIIY
jgi:hypothetical protein